MKLTILSSIAVAVGIAPLAAQQSGYSDNGMLLPPVTGSTGNGGQVNGAGCGTGSTTTFFAGGNSFAGNMFDIAPSADMTIECVDVNWDTVESIDVAVWYCPGTVVGNDVNQLGTWVQFGSGTVMAAGANLPTNVPLTGSNPVFLAGQTYGIYVQVVNYATIVGSLLYTNGGPTTYTGTHCSLTTYYGKGDGLTSSTFSPREFNGTLHTAASGPGGPTLGKSGTCPGSMSVHVAGCTPGGGVAIIYGQAGSHVKGGAVCNGTVVRITRPTLCSVLNADASGNAGKTFNAPPGACGLTVQAVDISTCATSNTVTL